VALIIDRIRGLDPFHSWFLGLEYINTHVQVTGLLTTMPTIRLALLLCDEIILKSPIVRTTHGGYAQIFRDFLSSSLKQITSGGHFRDRCRLG
jgi:uncharacterized membrane protein